VTQKNPFSTAWRHDINVAFELVNERGKAIGSQTYSKRAEYSPRRNGNQISIAYNEDDFATLTFNAVKAADISDRGMTIRVASVNGAPPEQTPFQITMTPDWEANTFLLVTNGVVTGFRSGVDISRYRELVIPATVWAEPVTAIGDNAFKEKQLSGVVIPDSVTAIGDSAFFKNQLSSVVIPDSVTIIGDSAFVKNQLSSVAIPDSVTTIRDSAFIRNPLRFIVIGKGVTSIANDAFNGETDSGENRRPGQPLYSVSIPGNVTFTGSDRSSRYSDDGNPYYVTWSEFIRTYDRNGKKAGTYVYGTSFPAFLWKYSPN
jgi:hypothetical protein